LRAKLRFEQAIQIGRRGPVNGVGFIFLADADTVNDNQQQRAFSALE
jgi:hypothetical protein